MREIHGAATAHVAADAATVFDLITDLGQLPRWNDAIAEVIDAPRALVPGAQWTVEMRPGRVLHWRSISTAECVDRDGLTFGYRTVNADGNPSYATWRWQVTPAGPGADVSVRWDVFLETWDRQHLAGPMRDRQLRKEVAASLDDLAGLAAHALS